MADPFVAEIRIFGFNFAPTGWAQCNGQLMPISQNTALFSLVGTFYGGDGRSTFGLPNMQGSIALHQGNGAGLTPRVIGEAGGTENVTLLSNEIPAHTHAVNCVSVAGNKQQPSGNLWAKELTGKKDYNAAPDGTPMNAAALAPAGGGSPHDNLQPYLVLNYCIALQGIFPPRS
jgi:microcystin-dependent protein